jgi:hypothetical protein
MTSCTDCCRATFGCKHQWIYFIVAVLLWAYSLAALFIPGDFPLQFGHLKDALLEPSLAVIAFTIGFVAVNIVIGAVANAQFNKVLASDPDNYLALKLRNACVAAFGFTALLRALLFVVWMVGYTA